jgi:hypothetical protein
MEEASYIEVSQIIDEFGCTPSRWATDQATEKLFEFYRIYPREAEPLPGDSSSLPN